MTCGEGIVAEAKTFDGAGGEVVEEDVGAGEQAGEDVASFGLLEVEDDAAFAAVEPGEICGKAVEDVIVVACEVAAIWALDFDDVGTEVGELAGAEGSGDGLLESEEAEGGEGEGLGGRFGCAGGVRLG